MEVLGRVPCLPSLIRAPTEELDVLVKIQGKALVFSISFLVGIWYTSLMEVVCDVCGKSFKKKGLKYHKWRMHGAGVNHDPNIGFKRQTRKAWNVGLTKETDARVLKNSKAVSKTLRKQVAEGTYVVRKAGSAWREKLSIFQSLYNRGGRCKWFTVNGQKVQGTWEKRLAMKFTELNIQWKKLKLRSDIWSYLDAQGTIRSYTPDFFLPEFNVYLDPK